MWVCDILQFYFKPAMLANDEWFWGVQNFGETALMKKKTTVTVFVTGLRKGWNDLVYSLTPTILSL